MVVAEIRATTLAEASSEMPGSNNKLAGDATSDLVLPSKHPVRGLSYTLVQHLSGR